MHATEFQKYGKKNNVFLDRKEQIGQIINEVNLDNRYWGILHYSCNFSVSF